MLEQYMKEQRALAAGDPTSYYMSKFSGEEIDTRLEYAENAAGALGMASTPQAALAALGAGVRPNLLDNACFVGGGTGWGIFPVNQRGQSAYTSGYGIDRWYGNSNITLETNCIKIVKTDQAEPFSQKISIEKTNFLKGKKYTISLLTADGSLYSLSDEIPFSYPYDGPNLQIAPNVYFDVIWQPSSENNLRARIVMIGEAGEASISAMKLEEGEGQTLAYQTGDGTWALLPQPDGDYQTQLLRCQSYLLVLNRARTGWVTFGQGNAYSESRCFLIVPTPVPLRATPTLAVSGELCLRNGADYPAVSSVTVYRLAENAVILDALGSGFTAGAQYDLMYANGDGGSLVLSAEL